MIWLAVALGGATGSIIRYGLSLLIPPQTDKFPWATLAANTSGCLMMGIFYSLIVTRQLWPAEWRPFLMTGFLGGLTTFSTFALESVVLWQHQQFMLATAYVISSLVLNLLLIGVGYYLADVIFSP